MNHQSQLTLLSDILKNQQANQHGTNDEFEQIQRLAKSLRQNNAVDMSIQPTLESIENYCASQNCNDTTSLTNWINSIDAQITSDNIQ